MTDLAIVEQEVLEPGQRSLQELTDEANREHGLVVEAGMSMLDHAIRAGEALIAVRHQVPEGKWLEWLDANFDGSHITSVHYMRIAHHKTLVRDAGITTAFGAMIYLRGIAGPHPRGHKGHGDAIKNEARRLHDAGMSYRQIAALLGVNGSTTIHAWCDPAFHAHRRRENVKRQNERNAKRRQQEAEKRERLIRSVVRKAGAAEQELYAMAERMQDIMGQAHREATDPEKRRHYSIAGEHYRKMRDEIVRALGVS